MTFCDTCRWPSQCEATGYCYWPTVAPSADAIRAARESIGLTQEQAGALIGVGRVSWTRYETGVRALTAAEWRYWCHVAGIERIPYRAARGG